MIKAVVLSSVLSISLCAAFVSFTWEHMLEEIGLQAIPIKQHAQFRKSHQRLAKARHHQRVKQKQIKQRFMKKATRKVLANSAAALTIGTLGVAATAATMEAIEYCAELEEAEEWHAVLSGQPIEEKKLTECAEDEAKHVQALLAEVRREGSQALSEALEF